MLGVRDGVTCGKAVEDTVTSPSNGGRRIEMTAFAY